MNNIFSNIAFLKPTNHSNVITRGSFGTAIGGALRGVVTVLSRGKFVPLACLGCCIIAIALKILQKRARVARAHVRPRFKAPQAQVKLPHLGLLNIVVKKTLLELTLEQWDYYSSRLSADDLENALIALGLPVKENDDFSSAWNPKAFISVVTYFAQQRQSTLTSPKEAFTLAIDNIEDVANMLIDIKMKKAQLPAFENQAARFLEAYIPVRSTDGSYIRGRHSKAEFEGNLRRYLTFLQNAL